MNELVSGRLVMTGEKSHIDGVFTIGKSGWVEVHRATATAGVRGNPTGWLYSPAEVAFINRSIDPDDGGDDA